MQVGAIDQHFLKFSLAKRMRLFAAGDATLRNSASDENEHDHEHEEEKDNPSSICLALPRPA
jgi:hypothetical protein